MAINLLEDPALKQRPRLREACSKLHAMALQAGPEAKMPTILELHSQLGVSVQTVHNAVRELEQRDILRTINGVGIYVASPQKLSGSGNIGILSTYHLDSEQHIVYWSRIFSGMRSAAAEKQRHLLLIDNADKFDAWDKIDGAVLSDSHSLEDPSPLLLQKPPKGFPCIALLNPVPDAVSVTADDFKGMYLLTQHLIRLGHRRIAFVASLHSGVSLLEQRRNGYLAALKDGGITHQPSWERALRGEGQYRDTSDYYFEEGKYAVQRWLSEGWRETGCTALVSQNDTVAYGAMTAFMEAGISVPQQVSVVGFDGSGLEYRQLPAVTSAKVPLFEIGRSSIRLLVEWLENPGKQPLSVSLPVQLVEGESSAPPPLVFKTPS